MRILEKWQLSNGVIIAEIQHQEEGLSPGSKIREGDVQYEIERRVLFNHIGTRHREFKNERTQISMLSFKDTEAMESSRRKVVEKETRGIYQYTIRKVE